MGKKVFLKAWIILLTAFPLISFSISNFEITPLKINWVGAVWINEKLIIYGTQGALLISDDKGKTWAKRFIDTCQGTIVRLVNYNDTLYGAISNGKILISTNFGKDWQVLNVENPRNESFLDLFVSDNALIVNTDSGFIRYTKKGELLGSIQVPHYQAYFYDNKIIVSGPNFNTNGFGYISEDLSTIHTINVRGKFLDEYNPETYVFEKIIKIRPDKYLLTLNGVFTVCDTSFENFTYFFPDKRIFNPYDSTYWDQISRLGFWHLRNLFFYLKDTLFIGTLKLSQKYLMKIPPFNSRNRPGTLWDYQLSFFSKDSLKFLPYNNLFENKYYTPNIRTDSMGISGESRNQLFLRRSDHYVFQDSIIVKVSAFNSIFLTTNKGKEWRLVSSLHPNCSPRFIFYDSIFVFLNDYDEYNNDVDRSTDGGITFIPTEIGLDTDRIPYVIVDSNYNPIDTFYTGLKTGYFSTSDHTYMFYIDSTGRGLWFGDRSLSPDDLDFAYTKDFSRTYKFERFKNSYFRGSNAIQLGPNYLFTLSKYITYTFNDSIHTSFYSIDTGFTQSLPTFLNTFKGFTNLYIMPSRNSGFILFGYAQNYEYSKQWDFEIRYTPDSGKTQQILYRLLFPNEEVIQFFPLNEDSLFFTMVTPPRLYLFDRKTNELKLLWEIEEGECRPMLMVISDRFYLVGRGLFLENADRSDLTQWREGEWDYGKPNFESVIFRGNVAIAGLSDSLRPFNYYKITLKKQEPSIVKEPTVEKRYYTTHFWASDPYPQPAKVRVKARVAWDGSFDLREAIDGVYDTMGRKVEGKERIRVDARSTTSGELEWECSGVPAGMYFILIRWRGGSETVPVVVE